MDLLFAYRMIYEYIMQHWWNVINIPSMFRIYACILSIVTNKGKLKVAE